MYVPHQSIHTSEEKDKGPLQKEETGLCVQSGGGDLARALHAFAPPRVLGRVRAVRLQNRATLERHRPTDDGHEDSFRRDLDGRRG